MSPKIQIHCSDAEKQELAEKADVAGLSQSNYSRKRLGWPAAQMGAREGSNHNPLGLGGHARKKKES